MLWHIHLFLRREMRIFRKTHYLGLAAILSIVLFGCGKNADDSVEYVSSEFSLKEVSNQMDGSLADYPSVQYEGDPLWEGTFSIGSIVVECYIGSIVYDYDRVQLILANEIDETGIHETEVVNRVFGETGREIRSIKENEKENQSSEIIGYCDAWMKQYADDETSQGDGCCTWYDNPSFFMHTYEGLFNGAEYQLLICFTKEEHKKNLYLFPKRIDALTEEGLYDYFYPFHGEEERLSETKIADLIGDHSNHTVSGEDDLIRKSLLFYDKTLCSPTTLSSYKHRDNERFEKMQILYYRMDGEGNVDDTMFFIDGYGFEMCWSHDWMSSWGEKPDNRGVVYVNDKGIVAAHLSFCYELVEEKETTVLAFEQLMKAFETHFQNEFDTSRVKGNKVSITSMRLLYMPLKSGEGHTVFTPIWEMPVWYEKGGGAVVYINAVNGEIERIEYGN